MFLTEHPSPVSFYDRSGIIILIITVIIPARHLELIIPPLLLKLVLQSDMLVLILPHLLDHNHLEGQHPSMLLQVGLQVAVPTMIMSTILSMDLVISTLAHPVLTIITMFIIIRFIWEIHPNNHQIIAYIAKLNTANLKVMETIV